MGGGDLSTGEDRLAGTGMGSGGVLLGGSGGGGGGGGGSGGGPGGGTGVELGYGNLRGSEGGYVDCSSVYCPDQSLIYPANYYQSYDTSYYSNR